MSRSIGRPGTLSFISVVRGNTDVHLDASGVCGLYAERSIEFRLMARMGTLVGVAARVSSGLDGLRDRNRNAGNPSARCLNRRALLEKRLPWPSCDQALL